MSEVLIWLCGGVLLLLGLIGCFVPILPGPLLGYASLWVMWLYGVSPGERRLWIGGGIVVVAVVVDYLLPSYFAQKFKCSRMGVFGCFVGTIVGLFFFPWGILVGPVLGTMLGELLVGKSLGAATRGGVGAFCGFVSCLLLKLAAVGLFGWWFVEGIMRYT